MKSFKLARPAAAILMAAVLLASPAAVMAKKGEKNYKQGLQYEEAQQWEKAAQEFALALATAPSDTEYLLHYRRSVFNASQVFMLKGKALFEKGDYIGAYNAYRQAYGLDPVNDLAAQEMDHMIRLQREKEGASNPSKSSPANYRPGQGGARTADGQADGAGPAPSEKLQTIQYSGDLEGFIRKLADELELNVVFDQNFSQVKRNVNIRWKNMTPARALDYVFLSNGLFFQKLDRRTILVADQSKRPMYQQLVLRTFYLYNITPDDARTLLTGALPANAGRQPQFISNKSTNSITVRDTPENIRIIEQLLRSVDKDRAEVVMEVAIYEISRNDLLQIGNQLGSLPSSTAPSTLQTLGGLQPSTVVSGRGVSLLAGAASLHSGLGFLIPASTISLFQSKSNTRLLFSTQVHAFDDEKSSTRVGSKVPVQTASVYNGLVNNNGTGGGSTGGAGNVFGSGGYPVIQYEDVGLNLDFKPKVYPNQDVQVSMTIESKDVAAGPDPLTPIFTQRKIEGVARIPNGKTMMIASIAQDRETDGRAGLPLISMLPIIGRLFTAPNKNNSQSDIVITMTPRVLRAPEILPSDEESRPTGTMQTPQAESLEAMVNQADREDQYARLRSLPTNQTVEVSTQQKQPSPEAFTFVPAPRALADAAAATAAYASTPAAGANSAPAVNISMNTEAPPPVARPAVISHALVKPAADASATNNAAPANVSTAAPSAPAVETKAAVMTNAAAAANVSAPAESKAELLLLPDQQDVKVGERRRVMVFLKTDAPLGLATATLRFDPRSLAVRSVTQGVLSADKAAAPVLTQSTDAEKGVLFVSISPASGAQSITGEGLLLVIEVEALAPGEAVIQFDADKLHLIATDGRTVRPKAADGRIKVTQ
ncbi:MAG TPA: secretin N-terminal domain-containing protein [Pyrinomonadaceae bacterium]|nr:secretin N-terminal domain-containing protein [Pyrinomonadaceae bacterium]